MVEEKQSIIFGYSTDKTVLALDSMTNKVECTVSSQALQQVVLTNLD